MQDIALSHGRWGSSLYGEDAVSFGTRERRRRLRLWKHAVLEIDRVHGGTEGQVPWNLDASWRRDWPRGVEENGVSVAAAVDESLQVV